MDSEKLVAEQQRNTIGLQKLLVFSALVLGASALPIITNAVTDVLTSGWFITDKDFWTGLFLIGSLPWLALPGFLTEYPWSRKRMKKQSIIATAVGLTSIGIILIIRAIVDALDFALANGLSAEPSPIVTHVSDHFQFLAFWTFLALILSSIAALYKWHNDLLFQTSIRLPWYHQSQFAGIYAAQQEGIFERAGLKVAISPGDPRTSPVNNLISGEDDFAIVSASDIIMARSHSEDITCVTEIMGTPGQVFFHHKELPIEQIADLKGKKVGHIKDFDEEHMLLGLLTMHGVSLDDMEMVACADQNDLLYKFLSREIDVCPGHICNELIYARADDNDVKIIESTDFGAPQAGDVLAVAHHMVTLNPDVVRVFRDCLIEGWELCRQDHQKAINITMQYLTEEEQTKEDRTHQGNCLRAMLVSIYGTKQFPREPSAALWQQRIDFIKKTGQLHLDVKAEEMYCYL